VNAARSLVVAIDGPSGSGKSTIAREVAARFRFRYLDTGAMYRAVTWYVLQRGMDPHDAAAVAAILTEVTVTSGTDPGAPTIAVNGTDVAVAIRGAEVTEAVSPVSAVPEVRAFLVERQRREVAAASAAGTGIVVEGRDIGSQVLPDADVKIYLTADPEERARRRARQDAEAEHGSRGMTATHRSISRRDELDSTRASSPLRMARDAHLLDSTGMDIAATIEAAVALVTAAGGAPR
jgi:cytidylate kinase